MFSLEKQSLHDIIPKWNRMARTLCNQRQSKESPTSLDSCRRFQGPGWMAEILALTSEAHQEKWTREKEIKWSIHPYSIHKFITLNSFPSTRDGNCNQIRVLQDSAEWTKLSASNFWKQTWFRIAMRNSAKKQKIGLQ